MHLVALWVFSQFQQYPTFLCFCFFLFFYPLSSSFHSFVLKKYAYLFELKIKHIFLSLPPQAYCSVSRVK